MFKETGKHQQRVTQKCWVWKVVRFYSPGVCDSVHAAKENQETEELCMHPQQSRNAYLSSTNSTPQKN